MDPAMIIKDFKVHQLAFADPPLRSSYGLHAPYALRTIIEIKSDDGVTGISETYGGDAPAAALEQLRPQIIGANPYRLTGHLSPIVEGRGKLSERSQTYLVPGENPLDATTRTFAAIEVACLDLIGKSVGQAVCDLIGGRVHTAPSLSAYSPSKSKSGRGAVEVALSDFYS